MLLWKDLKTELASYAGDGSCDPDFVAKELNRAIRRLMCSRQWKSLTSQMRMAIIDTVFPMPYNVETVLGISINGRPSQIYGTEYQVVNGGPGDLDFRGGGGGSLPILRVDCSTGLADMGEHATMFDVPLDREGYVLAAFCTSSQDVGRTIRVVGTGVKNEEVAEDLQLTRWDGGVEGQIVGGWGTGTKITSHSFRGVSRVILPSTRLSGYFSLYAVYPSENQMFFLGKYHPSLRVPAFRRYRLTTPISDDLSSPGSCATVLAQVKLKFVPYVDDYDVVPFESEEAIQYMMMAANAEKTNPQNGAQYEALALRLLGDVEASKDTYRGVPIIIGSNPVTGLGRYMRSSMAGRL